MTFNEWLDLKNEVTKVDVLLGILDEKTLLIPLLLNTEEYTVRVFASELVTDLTRMEDANVLELKTFAFENLRQAERFYNEMNEGQHMEQLLKVYLKKRELRA